MLALHAIEDPKWPAEQPFPPIVKGFTSAMLADETNSYFELAPSAVVNPTRARKVRPRSQRHPEYGAPTLSLCSIARRYTPT